MENELTYKLGKLPASNKCKLKLRDYIDLSKLPDPPENFGHQALVPDWQMLGNDALGDCAIAGPYHALMYWNATAGTPINVDTECTISAYSAITGYDPSDPSTDQGSDVNDVANYWRTTGLTDADGKVHKIDAFVALETGNVDELWIGTYLFEGVGIGVAMPQEWMDATNEGKVWDEVSDPNIEGGHYIFGTGRVDGNLNIVTWGQNQLLTPAGYEQFSDEALVYFDEEIFNKGKDIDGFDVATLKADLLALANEG